MGEPVRVQVDGGNARLVLNRPERRNALSHQLLVALAEALKSPTCANSTAVTITGAGSSFSAGADAKELTGTIEDLRVDDDIARVTDAIRALHVPVTALVNGPCMGGAVDIVLACDDRIASPQAVFQVPATRLSLLYNPVAVQHMVARYGAELVARILADGERFDANEALAAGMVSAIEGETPSELPEHVPEPSDPGPVARATRAMIEAIRSDAFDLAHWQGVRREFLDSEERRQAVAAFKASLQVEP